VAKSPREHGLLTKPDGPVGWIGRGGKRIKIDISISGAEARSAMHAAAPVKFAVGGRPDASRHRGESSPTFHKKYADLFIF
jgi:hypothetical protein